jgi:hypothetical protein
MILNDMGMNLLADAPPAKVTERKHPKKKSGSEIQGRAAGFSDAVNEKKP